MARIPGQTPWEFSDEHSTHTLTWAYVERVTRIELALSAWESDRSTPPGPLTSQAGRPGVSVIDRSLPWLIAR